MSKSARIVIVGSYPPPYGGVSVYIQRLMRLLEEKHIPYEIYCYRVEKSENLIKQLRTRAWLFRYLFFKPGTIFHFHTPVGGQWLLIGFMGLCGRTAILTVHSINLLQDKLDVLSPLQKALLIFSMRRIPRIVVTGTHVKALLVSLGIKPERITVIAAFLPPMKSQSDFNGIPASTWQFIAEHHPVVSVCAFQFGFYKGEEIYGIDMCVELCSELKKQYPQIGFVCAVAEVGDATYFKEIQKRIKQKNIENNFHFVLEPCEFYPLLPKSDLFVRPTCTDAYGVSVAEAIHFGVPAVASDVCERSRGAILFEARNQGDFLKKVREVLANPRVYRERLNQVLQEDTFEKLLELYNQLGLEVS